MPTASFLEHILGVHPDTVDCTLISISHPDLAEPVRVTNNGEAIVSNGDTFTAWPFVIELPGDTEGAPVARLRIANVDWRIGSAIESINTPADVSIMLVLASEPDTVQFRWDGLELRNTTRTALEVSGDLALGDYDTEPFPSIRVRAGNFPNLYK